MMIDYKWIDGEELAKLDPIFEAQGWTKLNLNTGTRALCAYEGDTLVGFFVIQLFPHVEPLYVDRTNPHGADVAVSLVHQMTKFMDEIRLRGYIVIADTKFAELMCERRGMEKITSPVYRG